MINKQSINLKKAIAHLGAGKVAILDTDTVPGLIALASDRKAVEEVYGIKRRKPDKAPIILISSIDDLDHFGVRMDMALRKALGTVWPGPTTVILPVKEKGLEHLHPAGHTLAFRIPKADFLQRVIKKTGPLIAPSANPEGLPTAFSTTAARKYFGSKVQLYLVNSRRKMSKPSTIIKWDDGKPKVIREGAMNKRSKKWLMTLHNHAH